ncbi:sensor histidine kinase [Nostoc sp. CMAA1605]|uniref:sensor histidine kinase n=1 Tax=Nostoc sp. CMAA1605 TaxID=2055159 RepID=UPI001F1E9CDE|nr:ATP-binding protein [Nostoc sp. CMAA1605]MCF4968586.1 histidine kinase [Nostoc sp. CMAA1605]
MNSQKLLNFLANRFQFILRLKKRAYRLKMAHKISWGYGIILGLFILGTTIGIEVGDYFLWEAWQQAQHSRQETELLYRLETDILRARDSQQQLTFLLERPQELQNKYLHLQKQIVNITNTWQAIKSFTDSQYHIKNEINNLHLGEIPDFLAKYHDFTIDYFHNLEFLVKKIKSNRLESPAIETDDQKLLLNFQNSFEAQKFEKILDDLTQIIALSAKDYARAIAAYDQADILRLSINIFSVILSTVIAAVLAYFTSQMIAHPLKAVTQVAQQITQNSDFDLQAPVISADEVGIMAIAFNQLLQHVRLITQELHEKNQRLEIAMADLKHTQTQIIQQEKMSSLGKIVAGVAHEINNPVSFIYGNVAHAREYGVNLIDLVQIYQQEYPHPTPVITEAIADIDLDFIKEDLIKLLSSIRLGAERIRKIVHSLRNFSRLDEAELKTVDIHQGIESSLLILQNRLQSHLQIQVFKEYQDLPLVECYPSQINQVFMNILLNAIDALEEMGNEYWQMTSTTPQIRIYTKLLEKNHIAISFYDNGIGMNEKVQAKVFDPFFTNKVVGKGMGLGLSVSYQIVTEQHRGKLYFNSVFRQGTEFVMEIPIQQSPSVSI